MHKPWNYWDLSCAFCLCNDISKIHGIFRRLQSPKRCSLGQFKANAVSQCGRGVCRLWAIFLNFECHSCILTAWNSSLDFKAPLDRLSCRFIVHSLIEIFLLPQTQATGCSGKGVIVAPVKFWNDFIWSVQLVWGLQWEHGSLQSAKLRTLSLQTRSSDWALYCNWNNLMLCDSSVLLCCRYVLMFPWNIFHTTQSHLIIFILLSVLHICRATCCRRLQECVSLCTRSWKWWQ